MEKKVKVHVFHTGEVNVDPAVPFRDISRNPIAYTAYYEIQKNVFGYLYQLILLSIQRD